MGIALSGENCFLKFKIKNFSLSYSCNVLCTMKMFLKF
jgi:hypothetical protein